MPNRSLFLTALAATVLALACPAAASASEGSPADQAFLTRAAADGSAEIALGQLALQKSSSPQTKQLAQHIVSDHTKANEQLVALARQKQITVAPEPDPAAKQEMDKLQKLDGDAFDRAYAQDMVKGHQQAIILFTKASTSATDSDIKQFAAQTLPVLKDHLQMARQLRQVGRDEMQGPTSPRSPMQETPSSTQPPPGGGH
ncbi:DUF4142 domain-containing protein [Dyella sp. LX-66]|uniref:DUF4142 domain-containing protein n=1 Tax=unclassified Dyella TaxID=2634549 RepID=UPI001BE00F7F|nr:MULTISPECIES: DUF4142 domain-containing protein [unclassified Dyella]MBT2118297.1 DUF4142 domain-containing protein [Dyella sp. LX-1]MBT2140180.1 DUF4142 domain-containing protein [Dyella sp. LX-66]